MLDCAHRRLTTLSRRSILARPRRDRAEGMPENQTRYSPLRFRLRDEVQFDGGVLRDRLTGSSLPLDAVGCAIVAAQSHGCRGADLIGTGMHVCGVDHTP